VLVVAWLSGALARARRLAWLSGSADWAGAVWAGAVWAGRGRLVPAVNSFADLGPSSLPMTWPGQSPPFLLLALLNLLNSGAEFY
jgi:hypothetical protein